MTTFNWTIANLERAPDSDVSGECAQVQAFASAIFTDEIKAAYAAKQQENI